MLLCIKGIVICLGGGTNPFPQFSRLRPFSFGLYRRAVVFVGFLYGVQLLIEFWVVLVGVVVCPGFSFMCYNGEYASVHLCRKWLNFLCSQ
jgi:hypothetical protein